MRELKSHTPILESSVVVVFFQGIHSNPNKLLSYQKCFILLIPVNSDKPIATVWRRKTDPILKNSGMCISCLFIGATVP